MKVLNLLIALAVLGGSISVFATGQSNPESCTAPSGKKDKGGEGEEETTQSKGSKSDSAATHHGGHSGEEEQK